MTSSQLMLGWFPPTVRDHGAILLQPCHCFSFFSHQLQHSPYTGTRFLERFLLARLHLLKMGDVSPVFVFFRA